MSQISSNLPVRRFENGIRRISQTAAEFKSRQRSSGASGQLGYAISSDKDWDFIDSLSAPNGATVSLRVTFHGDGTQRWPIVIPLFDLRVNGTDLSNQVKRDGNGMLSWRSGGNFFQVSSLNQMDLTLLEDPQRLRWDISGSCEGDITYYLKARGQGSSDGFFTVEKL